MRTETTLFRSIDWLVAWDDVRSTHVYLRNANLVFTGDRIDFVGWGYSGGADHMIDGKGLMVVPGFVNLHSHPWAETLHKGYIEDFGNPLLGMMAMYNMMPGWIEDKEVWRTVATVAYCELLRSGVTTLVDISPPYEGWTELLAASGLRGVLAPSMASASWSLSGRHTLRYEWREDGGATSFSQAMDVIDTALCHPSGRLSAMVFPAQVDTCTESFFRRAKAAAAERGLPLQTHAAQSVTEFDEMVRRYGRSPIGWLDDIGFLSPEVTIGHAIFLDSHSWIRWGRDEDLMRLAENQTSIAHSPTVFLRTAAGLEHFARYREAGVNVALATDTFPNNMLEEIRLVGHLGRLQSRRLEGTRTADIFHAATMGGARALLRKDIGRLASGCRADFFTVSLDHSLMQPLRDPLRGLIHTAAERAVMDVYVAGQRVVRDGKVLTLDYDSAVARLTQLSKQSAELIPCCDPLHRTVEMLMPLTLEERYPPGEFA
jgi:5-methylthioadenosine/S-adenosylhomocysteine deaminase